MMLNVFSCVYWSFVLFLLLPLPPLLCAAIVTNFISTYGSFSKNTLYYFCFEQLNAFKIWKLKGRFFIGKYIFSFTTALNFFLLIHISIWYHFFFTWRTSFNFYHIQVCGKQMFSFFFLKMSLLGFLWRSNAAVYKF